MNNIQIVLNQVLVIYIMILIGIYASKIKIINSQVNFSLSKLLLNVTLPLFIISAFNYDLSTDILKNMLIILIFGFIIHPLCYLLGLLIYHKHPISSKSILIFALIFTNCGYMAYPILESIYGKIGIIYGSIFLAPFNIYLWTIGLSLFKSNETKHKLSFINPGVIAVFIGFIIFIFSINLPYFIEQSINIVGGMTTPLSMLIIGGTISEMNFKEMFKAKSIYINSFIRLIVIPSIVFFTLKLFHIDKIVFGVCVLLISMPVAVTSPIFAKRYDGNTELASKSIFISTLLSIFTIPIIVLLVLN